MQHLPDFVSTLKKRNAEPEIAEKYAQEGFDVMMGGGDEFFNAAKREDKKDIYSLYQKKGYQILKNRTDLQKTEKGKNYSEYLALVLYPTPLTELISSGFRILLLFQR